VKFCTSREGMKLAFPTPNTTPTRRSMVNEALYAGKGPAHWKVFYDTLDKLDAAPIPAPPQQAAVETALIKNVLGAVTGSEAGLKASLSRLDRDLNLALGRN
jgi:multiple sugar transport system substrate-binding protein